MTKLLHISASPRGEASASLRIARTFVDAYAATHPDATVEHWDLWDGSLPDFGPAAAHAKMTVFAGQTPTGEQARAWRQAEATFERFDSADRLLFSVPMWNAGIPYILKQLIDVIPQGHAASRRRSNGASENVLVGDRVRDGGGEAGVEVAEA